MHYIAKISIKKMYPKAKILIAIWQIIAAHASVSSTNTMLLKH